MNLFFQHEEKLTKLPQDPLVCVFDRHSCYLGSYQSFFSYRIKEKKWEVDRVNETRFIFSMLFSHKRLILGDS